MRKRLIPFLPIAAIVLATVAHGADKRSTKYDKEIKSIKTYTTEFLDVSRKNIDSIYRMKAVYDRIARAMDRVLQKRRKVVESCKQYWWQQDELNFCLAQMRFTLAQMRDELDFANEVFDRVQGDVKAAYAINSLNPQNSLDEMEAYRAVIRAMDKTFYAEIKKRHDDGLAHFIKQHGVLAVKNFDDKLQPYKDYANANAFLWEIKAAQRLFSENVQKAITQNRYLYALNQLNAMDWLSGEFKAMTETLAARYQKSAVFKKMLAEVKADYAKEYNVRKADVETAAKNRPAMLEARLPVIVSEVKNADLNEKDRAHMLQSLSTAEAYLNHFKTTKSYDDLRKAEIEMEQVTVWMGGKW